MIEYGELSTMSGYLNKIGIDKDPSPLCPLCKTEPYTSLIQLHKNLNQTHGHGFEHRPRGSGEAVGWMEGDTVSQKR